MKKLHPGEAFNPHGLFVGAFIPNCIMRYPALSPTAKLAWARLQQFGGEAGKCYPSYTTTAEELGISRRHAVRAIKELVDKGFLKRISPTPSERGTKATTSYLFLWHPCFDAAAVRGGNDVDVTRDGSVTPLGTNTSHTRDGSVPRPRDGSVTPLGTNTSHNNNHLKHQKEDINHNNYARAHAHATPEPEVVAEDEGGGGCGGESSLAEKEFEKLSQREQRYVEAMVKVTGFTSGFKSSPSAYRNALIRKAKEGRLDTSDLEDREEQASHPYVEPISKAGRTAVAAVFEAARRRNADDEIITSTTTSKCDDYYAGARRLDGPTEEEKRQQQEQIDARVSELEQEWLDSGMGPKDFVRERITGDGKPQIDDIALKTVFERYHAIERARLFAMIQVTTYRKLGMPLQPLCKCCDHFEDGIGCSLTGDACDGEQKGCSKCEITKSGYAAPDIMSAMYGEYNSNGNGRAKHETAH